MERKLDLVLVEKKWNSLTPAKGEQPDRVAVCEVPNELLTRFTFNSHIKIYQTVDQIVYWF